MDTTFKVGDRVLTNLYGDTDSGVIVEIRATDRWYPIQVKMDSDGMSLSFAVEEVQSAPSPVEKTYTLQWDTRAGQTRINPGLSKDQVVRMVTNILDLGATWIDILAEGVYDA